MNPEQLEKRIVELENALEKITKAENEPFVDSLTERIFIKRTDIDTSGSGPEERSITVGAGGGTFEVLDYPDKFQIILIDGKRWKVPVYNIQSDD